MSELTGSEVSIRIAPEHDNSVLQLVDRVNDLKRWADFRVIGSLEGILSAIDDLTLISNLKRALEEKRKEYVGPLNDYVKTINAVFKQISQPLEDADKITRDKILAYRREQEDIRQKLEEAVRLQAEALTQQAKAGLPVTEVAPITPAPLPVPDKIYRDTGSLGTFKVRKWEVVNFAEVPDDYKVVDAARITKVIKAGIPSIPGIRIWDEEALRVTATRIEKNKVDFGTGEIESTFV